MVRVPGRVSVNASVERAAREVVYVNNHDSAIAKAVAFGLNIELSCSFGLLPKSCIRISAASYINIAITRVSSCARLASWVEQTQPFSCASFACPTRPARD